MKMVYGSRDSRIRVDVGVAVLLKVANKFAKTGNCLLPRQSTKVVAFSTSVYKLLFAVKDPMFCKGKGSNSNQKRPG